jgi:UDP-N-acetylglucosamine diphosphorylase / glucose-1-phosphate thymidylyltransferase / UDP-N-acetylgalactosamine diphosphorylase / glucosamine-1-phosphate N-acetyltransferase / galactosamine-1-phosphate N-acetyltransferase
MISIPSHIAEFERSPLSRWQGLAPWEITSQSADIVRSILNSALTDEFNVSGDIAVHKSALIEPGAVLKGPLVVSAGCLVAAGAYLRGGCWVAENCIFGPGAELKSSFVFSGTKLAHFNFVGDSVLGAGVNLEAGSIICNYRNERESKEILVRIGGGLHRTGSVKFGALVGDRSRVGANAVLAPGAILRPGSVVRRTELCDQEAL